MCYVTNRLCFQAFTSCPERNVDTMKEKLLEVLSYLSRQNTWKTASEISITVGYSVRSVKAYISEINQSYPNLISTSRKGYLLADFEQAVLLLNKTDNQIPQTPEGRKAYIMQKLLIENQIIGLDDLANDLCISPLTLNNEIAKFKKELIVFDLVSHTKNNQIWIEGNEKNKKKMISHMIYENTKDFCCNMDSIQIYLPNFDLRIVRQIVTSSIMEHHFFIDDFSLKIFVTRQGYIKKISLVSLRASNVQRLKDTDEINQYRTHYNNYNNGNILIGFTQL